ncbi:acyltransferase family protein [Vibrio rotiferianus]|uniref:acyltransferase family protein n=1 Tax=Vibrio rotiferianus TaxID=190895 RepID=UPI00406A3B18
MVRTPYFDNAKFILVFLVVLGHVMEPVIENSPVIKATYLSIYSFHMPAFVIISGMLSRSDASSEAVAKTVRNILVPFVVFTVAYEVFNYLTTGSISNYSKNIQPYWILWFLYSLFLWKLMLPTVLKCKFPISLTLLIAVCAGYFDSVGYDFGLSRTLYFLPFFVIGHKITPEVFTEFRNKYATRLNTTALIVIVLNLVFFAYNNDMSHQWLYGSFSYSRLGSDGISAGLIRLGFMFISLLTAFAVLMLIPVGSSKILSQGKNSLYVYTWHGFITKVLVLYGVTSAISNYSTIVCLSLILVFSMTLTLMLSQEYIAKATNQFVLKPLHHILVKDKPY